ncbi:MAG TPA: universal stress protein [Burkholderiales bacterium]
MKILVPVDGSQAALRAVKHAAAVAAHVRGGEVLLLNVQPILPMYGMVRAYMRVPQYKAARATLARQALVGAERLLKRAKTKHRDHVMYGDPGETIADAARKLKCRMIVMGTRGQGAVGNLILGSVATKVIHLAKVPVTLVK